MAVDGRSKLGQNGPLAGRCPRQSQLLLCPRALHSCALLVPIKYHTFIQFLRHLSVLTVYVTSYLATQSFPQYCNLSTDHCTAGPPNRLPSLHTRFKVEHVVNVVPKFSMKILVVGDCELVQLTPPGLREGYCATRYVMRFSEWNLFDASY